MPASSASGLSMPKRTTSEWGLSASRNPRTGQPWGLDFPVITVRDMVRAQAMLLDRLGIDTVFAVEIGRAHV